MEKRRSSWRMFLMCFLIGMLLTTLTPPENVSAASKKKVTIKGVENETVYVGKKTTLKPKASQKSKFTFKSSNPSVVSVSAKGVLTVKKLGDAKITITAKPYSSKYSTGKKTITVTVKLTTPKIMSLKADGETVTVKFSTVKGAKRYVVSYATDTRYSDGVSEIVSENTFSFEGKEGKTYYVTVQAAAKEGLTRGEIIAESFTVDGGVVKANGSEESRVEHITIGSNKTKLTYEKASKPSLNSKQSVYAEIPELGVSYGVRENKVKYGASCMKFVYSYYAYCVKGWGNVKLTYSGETNTLETAAWQAVRYSNNQAARAIFDYIRTNSKRRAEFLAWMKKILKKEVPTMTDGYKYRIGYNSSSAYCPFTTAKELTTFWKYIWKDGYQSSKINKERYSLFFNFCYTTWLWGLNSNVDEEHGKIGLTRPKDMDGSVSEWTVMTNGAFYEVKLADGNTYTMFLSFMEDNITDSYTGIWNKVNEVVKYVTYLGNKALEEKD